MPAVFGQRRRQPPQFYRGSSLERRIDRQHIAAGAGYRCEATKVDVAIWLKRRGLIELRFKRKVQPERYPKRNLYRRKHGGNVGTWPLPVSSLPETLVPVFSRPPEFNMPMSACTQRARRLKNGNSLIPRVLADGPNAAKCER